MNQSRNIAIIDTETTGTDVSQDRIVQVALLIVDRQLNEVHPLVSSLINPEMPISPGATEVHKITDEMVANAPTFQQVAHSLYDAIKDCDLCFYNGIKFDLPLLIEEFSRSGIDFHYNDKNLIDPFIVFRKKESRNLSAALKFYTGKDMTDAHDAGADVMATLDVLRGQMSRYEDLSTIEAINALGEPENRCDLAGKFIKKDGVVVFNFGKHFMKPAVEEKKYLDWMIKGDFPSDTKNFINRLLNK